MPSDIRFLSAISVLASLDIERLMDFLASKLGFAKLFVEQGVYGVAARGPVSLHYWASSEKHIAENTSCRIQVDNVLPLYTECVAHDIVHPKAHLESKPWGTREFGVLDPDGNLITFSQSDERN
jgi:hypothetical protein